MTHSVLLLSFLLAVAVFLQLASSMEFQDVNSGDLGDYVVEYRANYRLCSVSTSDANFQLVFFNTTPDNWELGIRMGSHHYAETMRIVWNANPNKPVGENSTLTFGKDGNFVLRDQNNKLVWSTNTANKGVVGVEMRYNGNMVLYDKNNQTVWQSFDYPSDSLLVGQSMQANARSKLVSRYNSTSLYKYVLSLEIGGLVMYAVQKGSNVMLPYWTLSYYNNEQFRKISYLTRACKSPLQSATFLSNPDPESAFDQQIELRLANTTVPKNQTLKELCGSDGLSTVYSFNLPRFPTPLSFMRIEPDGNLRFYSYSSQIELNTWTITYEKFGCRRGDECGLPAKCGTLGLCQNSQCVGCPQPDGLFGWSNKCSSPALAKCGDGAIKFYSVAGAEHYSLQYSDGKKGVKLEDCKASCAKDCKCAAYFYWKESSTCFLTPDVGTLNQSENSDHLAFIKIPASA